ncbi:TetR/AcrR family transcriptional regulator [Actinoplanes sp. L3-i22]|uniref:TetR/AcrR family transcriptional regulator n=1 Tax=Actinoplanes sp. L3-i22 TaxID=2836373 RepID=UPI001C772F1C|nr:TetR/AcrR family transcriptional regulator [Actinoplanes sp. L3-i22]BCY11510.1 TetR family transcriptional regulator [Actinoplanes sp. L3-i22]
MSLPGKDRRPYDARRRQDAARQTRAAVLTAFGELLFAEGYRGTTIQAVAARAGVSPETVYKTFGGKAGLTKALWDVTVAGDDEPVVMAEREQLREVWATEDPEAKMLRYAGFVRGVNERLAGLAALLAQAGPEAAEVLADSERERRAGVGAFTAHLADTGVLRAGVDPASAADGWWVLTGPRPFTDLTVGCGWDGARYEQWLAGLLAANLL